MTVETRRTEDDRDFNRLVEDNRERARKSRREGYGLLRLTLLLLVGTVVTWHLVPEITKKDIDDIREVTESIEAEPPPADFYDVARCGEDFLAVGDRGSILSFTDDDMSWQGSSNGARHDLGAVALSGDCMVAVAVGEQGAILVSTDGGSTWSAPDTNTRNDFNEVALSDDGEIAIAVGEKGLFRFSYDGGESWRNPGNFTGKSVNDVVLSRDGRTAVAVGDNNLIMVFTREDKDGGQWKEGEDWTDGGGGNAWTRSGGKNRDDFEAVALGSDGRSAVVVGDNGAILFSADVTAGDGGWERQTDKKDRSDFEDVAFGGQGETATVIAVGRRGVVRRSADCGRTWRSSDSKQGNSLEAVSLGDKGKIAVAVGRDGTVLVSEDKGVNWTFRDSRTANRLYGVAFDAQSRMAIIVGDDSIILRSKSTSEEVFPEMTTVPKDDIPLPEESGPEKIDAGEQQEDQQPSLLAGLIHSNLLRVGITVLFMFMAQHLFGLARYKFRLAAYYDARHDAILLIPADAFPRPENIDEIEQLMQALSPDTLEIGRPSKTIMDRMMQMMDRFTAGDRSR